MAFLYSKRCINQCTVKLINVYLFGSKIDIEYVSLWDTPICDTSA